MRLIAPLVAAFAASKGRTTWYIDANNLLGHKGTPRDAEGLQSRLQLVRGVEKVVVVFDGKESVNDETTYEYPLEWAILKAGYSADDFIVDCITSDPGRKVQVVTADRELRRRVLSIKPRVLGVVNPVTFWRRYIPRLCGLKSTKVEASTEST